MRTKILSLFLWCTLMVGVVSCDLSESPYGFYSEKNFYKTLKYMTKI